MLREELTALLSAFEAKQPVDAWLWNGWRVWPVVRTHLARSLHQHVAPAGAPRWGARLVAAARWRQRRLRRFAAQWGPQWRPDRPADWIFLSSTNRAQQLAGAVYNTVVDPWVEEIARAGGRANVWDLGDPRTPSLPSHVNIQHAADVALRRARTPLGQPPCWFPTLVDFVVRELGGDIGWPEISCDLQAVDAHAALFETWLRRARPRAVVLDCWYLCDRMGAALAAHRLRIPSIDLQHGIQGRAHPAYAGWSTRPVGGYEVFPDQFWVWGSWDAESLVASNPGVIDPACVRIVGHRWLSAWSEADAPRYAAEVRAAEELVGSRHTVLVTLQKGVPYRDTLVSLMRHAPADWLWLVRLHRGMAEDPRQVQADLQQATGRNAEVVEATRLPLYALLRACAWHVTAFSTCALEALAFGVPTLLTHESGAHAYSEFVEARVMRRSPRSAEESIAILAADSTDLTDACRKAARRVFAEPVSGEAWCTSC